MLVSLVIMFVLIAGYSLFHEGYGYGYSEELREAWNELNDELQMRVGPVATISIVPKEKVRKIADLQRMAAPDWQVAVAARFEPSLLPLEGLTAGELCERANGGGDADACLLMAWENIEERTYYTIQNRRLWLGRAAELGRPGVDFLLKVVDAQDESLPKTLRGVFMVRCVGLKMLRGWRGLRMPGSW